MPDSYEIEKATQGRVFSTMYQELDIYYAVRQSKNVAVKLKQIKLF